MGCTISGDGHRGYEYHTLQFLKTLVVGHWYLSIEIPVEKSIKNHFRKCIFLQVQKRGNKVN